MAMVDPTGRSPAQRAKDKQSRERSARMRDSLGVSRDADRGALGTILSGAVAEAPIPEPLILPVTTKPIAPLEDPDDPVVKARKKRAAAARGLGETILSDRLGG